MQNKSKRSLFLKQVRDRHNPVKFSFRCIIGLLDCSCQDFYRFVLNQFLGQLNLFDYLLTLDFNYIGHGQDVRMRELRQTLVCDV